MIAVIDYGVGNLFSLTASLKALDLDCMVTADPEVIKKADGIILPGVGAFGDAAMKLKEKGLKDLLIEEAKNGKPFLGICLGMQLLFEKSYEYGEHEGLGLIRGYVGSLREDIENKDAIVPHMGWNELVVNKDSEILLRTQENTYVYFVHSFYAKECSKDLIAYSEYEGVKIPAIVGRGNVYGMQFHPEKSGERGLVLLRAFADIVEKQ